MERWEPQKMNRFSEKVMARLREEAKAMQMMGEELQSIDLGEQKDALWLSTDPEKVVGTEKIEMGGQTFYIGILREDTEE